MEEITAISRARQVLKSSGINTAPVDVDALAAALGFQISRRDLPHGEAGNTFTKRNQKYILVNQNDGLARQRFTILHEIAHHVLELSSVHGEKVSSDELERYKGRPYEEVLCDVFAAECLVPWHLIQPIASEQEFTLQNLVALSERFEASRACVASRFAQASKDYLAYVVAEDGVIQYAITSGALRSARIWISKDIPLPRKSAAAEAIKAESDGIHIADLEATDWSSSDEAYRFACYEEATYYAAYNQTISLLTFEEVDVRQASVGYRTSNDEGNELLSELTGYPGWSKPR